MLQKPRQFLFQNLFFFFHIKSSYISSDYLKLDMESLSTENLKNTSCENLPFGKIVRSTKILTKWSFSLFEQRNLPVTGSVIIQRNSKL